MRGQPSPEDAVRAAYPEELERCHEALRRGIPVLVECDKELTAAFAAALRARLETGDGARRCVTLDGWVAPGGLVAAIIAQLRQVVREAGGPRVVILSHLDLFGTASDPSEEARELVPLLNENHDIVALGFHDHATPLPRAVERLFARRETLYGVTRERFAAVASTPGAFGLDAAHLHRHLSGVNAVRLGRVLGSANGPADLRAATLSTGLWLPRVDLDADIGGYPLVKQRLRREILDVLARVDAAGSLEEMARIEALVPRGVVLWGPPGTGKTLLASALASSLGAAFTLLSGPELKSRWAAGQEWILAQTFARARQAAPAVIMLDELDAFAGRRGMYAGSIGVEHAMVNALLAELDQLRRDERVIVVGTTNVTNVLDPALLRPGRFELEIEIAAPDAADRRAILGIYDARFGLALSPAALDYAVERTGDVAFANGAAMTGDHLQALARGIARARLRGAATDATEAAAVEEALADLLGQKPSAPERDRVVAVHEAGHALAAMVLGRSVDRLAVGGDLGNAVGATALRALRRGDATRTELLDAICILLAGREAEDELLGDLTAGAAHDLTAAAAIARALAGDLGMGPALFADLEMSRAAIDLAARDILRLEQERSRRLLEEQREALAALSTELLRRKVLDRPALEALVKLGEPEV